VCRHARLSPPLLSPIDHPLHRTRFPLLVVLEPA
jgi:hypothetical protein